MTIIITKFNYAYEVKKRTFKRSKLSPVIQSETEDNTDTLEGDSSPDRMHSDAKIRNLAWRDVVAPRSAPLASEPWHSIPPHDPYVKRDAWRDMKPLDLRSHDSREDVRDGLQRADNNSVKAGDTYITNDVTPPDVTPYDSVHDVRDGLLISKDRLLHKNDDGFAVREPQVRPGPTDL